MGKWLEIQKYLIVMRVNSIFNCVFQVITCVRCWRLNSIYLSWVQKSTSYGRGQWHSQYHGQPPSGSQLILSVKTIWDTSWQHSVRVPVSPASTPATLSRRPRCQPWTRHTSTGKVVYPSKRSCRNLLRNQGHLAGTVRHRVVAVAAFMLVL